MAEAPPNRLKELRLLRKESLAETAKGIGTSVTALSNYENLSRSVNSEILAAAADHFGCTIDYIVYRSDNPNETYSPPKSPADTRLIQLNRRYAMLDESDKTLLNGIAGVMLNQKKYR